MFDLIRKMLAAAPDAPPSAATIAAAIDVIDAKAAEGRAALASAEDRRADAVLHGDAAAGKVRHTLAAIADDLADLSAARTRLVQRLADARAAEAEADRQAAFDRATKMRDAAAKSVASRYPRLRRELLALIREVAEADAVADAVNRELPAGAAPIDAVEAFRDRPALAEKVVATVVSERWVARPEHGGGAVDTASKGFVDNGDGTATFVRREPGSAFSRTGVADRITTTTQTLLPWAPGMPADRLATMRLPAMRLHDTAYDLTGRFSIDASDILAALDQAAAEKPEPPAPERLPVTRSESVHGGPAVVRSLVA